MKLVKIDYGFQILVIGDNSDNESRAFLGYQKDGYITYIHLFWFRLKFEK